jgi:hypothetical protein
MPGAKAPSNCVAFLILLYYKPGGDRVHVCVMGWKWGLAPVGFWEKNPLLAKKS